MNAGDRAGRWTLLHPAEGKRWLCRCDCGTERAVLERSLRYGESLSCGCLRREKAREVLAHDITGQRFGSLTALRPVDGPVRPDGVRWLCLCDCGRTCEYAATLLMTGRRTHCGCQTDRSAPIKDIAGQRFGRLTALYPTGETNAQGRRIWHCRCDCGSEVDVTYNELLYTPRQSCGCQKKEHDALLQQNLTRVAGTSVDYLRSQKLPVNNTTGVKGVYHIRGKYVAKIVFQKKAYYCGAYDDFDDAVRARKEAETLLAEGTIRHFERWKARADRDPAWAKANPVDIRVEKGSAGNLAVRFLPEMNMQA